MSFIGAPHTIREAGGFRFGHWFATRDVKPHVHENAHYMFIVAGEFATTLHGCSKLLYNPPDTLHPDRFETGGSFFAIDVPEALAPKAPSSRIDDVRAHALVSRLMRENANWCADSADVAHALCLELISPPSSEKPAWLRRVHDAVREDASIESLAAVAGVHPVHLTRTFRRFYHCTPGEYLRALRCARAAELLATSSMPLSELALEAGFADQPHFTKVFRQIYGVTPNAYRRECLK